MEKLLSYSDIVLTPAYSNILSRRELDVSVEFLGHKFNSVAIPANMACCINFSKAEELSELGYFYVMHRFVCYDDLFNWVKCSQDLKTISISVGVQQEDRDLITMLQNKELRVDFVTIDVAHGDHLLVRNMISYIKEIQYTPDNKFKPKIIAGNVGTVEAAKRLKDWGADAIKVGISCGRSCTTYNCTGVGTPMFSTVNTIFKNVNFPIIADGQIREVGDISKALVAGAAMIMIGSEFARCYDSPAFCRNTASNFSKKVFFGNASKENTNSDDYVEGSTVYLDKKEASYEDYFKQINQGIQSTMSYAGMRGIRALPRMQWATK